MDPIFLKMTHTFTNQENQTVLELNLQNDQKLALEQKNDGEEFLEFNENSIEIVTKIWNPIYSECSNLPVCEKLQINKDSRLKDLQSILA